MIRMPDFVDSEIVEKAKKLVESKKGFDLSKVKFEAIQDGLCL